MWLEALRTFAIAIAAAVAASCGPSLPPRYVLERDLGALLYRRYQRVLDVEFPIEGNAAVGHTATYVRRSARGEVPYVNVFVTVYERAPGLSAEIRRQVQTLESYEVRVADVGGGRAWSLDGGEGDRWFLWVSQNRVVKVGGAAEDMLVRSVVSEYMGLYPSDLDEHGRARPGTASAGEPAERDETGDGIELPRSLSNGDGESE